MKNLKLSPLKIKNILVSQPQPDLEKSPYADIIKKFNVKIDFRKFFIVEGIQSKDFKKDRINLPDFTAIIFTSKNAVDHYFRICNEIKFVVPDTMKYICQTEAIALYLQKYVQYRKRKIFHANQTNLEMLEIIKKHKSENFLLPCSEPTKLEIPKLLDENKINYCKAVFYRNIPDNLADINIKNYDMLAFFSPSGIRSLFHNFPDFNQKDTIIATFGDTTATEAKSAGLNVNIKVPNPKAPSMTMAIDQYLEKELKESKNKEKEKDKEKEKAK